MDLNFRIIHYYSDSIMFIFPELDIRPIFLEAFSFFPSYLLLIFLVYHHNLR